MSQLLARNFVQHFVSTKPKKRPWLTLPLKDGDDDTLQQLQGHSITSDSQFKSQVPNLAVCGQLMLVRVVMKRCSF
jgi:hypothetical protein